MPPTILITRPKAAGARFADQLRERLGCDVPIVLSPLMRIEQVGALPDLTDVQTLIFTSGNGVAVFTEQTDRRDIPGYCVGDATARAASEAGLEITSASGASDDLIARILADGVSGPCLHVRGEHGAGDVANRLTTAGIPTDEAIIYRQISQPLSRQASDLLRSSTRVIVPLFSPRTARLLCLEGPITAPARIVALSKNVAAELTDGCSMPISFAKNPDAESMLTEVQSLVEAGKPLEAGKPAQ